MNHLLTLIVMLKFIKYDRTSLGWEEVSLGDGEMEGDLTSLCFLIVVHFRIEHTPSFTPCNFVIRSHPGVSYSHLPT